MLAQKRPAHDSSHPPRKHLRTAYYGLSGETASASETEGLRSRWLSFLNQGVVLVRDTAQIPFMGRSTPPPLLPPTSNSLPSTRDVQTSDPNQFSAPATTSTNQMPPDSRSSQITFPSSHSSTADDAPLPYQRDSVPLTSAPLPPKLSRKVDPRHTSAAQHSATSQPPQDDIPLSNGLGPSDSLATIPDSTDRFSSQASASVPTSGSQDSLGSSSSRSTWKASPPTTVIGSSSRRTSSEFGTSTYQSGSQPSERYSLEYAGVSRKYTNRPHLYAEKHKAHVAETQKKEREQMAEELFRLRKTTGNFSSDFSAFRGWLSYRARLEMLERRGTLEPSPSLTDLRSSSRFNTPQRRHSMSGLLSEDVDPAFLKRALEKAKQALQTKPPALWSPSLDELQSTRRARDALIEQRLRPKGKPLPSSLPPQDEDYVGGLMRRRGDIAKLGNETVKDSDLARLRPGQWLNDEIINFYGKMILTRSEACKENKPNGKAKGGETNKPLNVHYFSTFFWQKLTGEGYKEGRLNRWTKKIDIFSKDIILIPVNHGNAHWTTAAINFRRKRIEAYDSMNMPPDRMFKHLRNYLNLEHMDKRKKPFDWTDWVDHSPSDTPQQENGFDCGVFTCRFLEALSCGIEIFNFSQKDMPYLRRRIMWEIGNSKLRGDD